MPSQNPSRWCLCCHLDPGFLTICLLLAAVEKYRIYLEQIPVGSLTVIHSPACDLVPLYESVSPSPYKSPTSDLLVDSCWLGDLGPFLKIGVTCPSFHACGKCPSSS